MALRTIVLDGDPILKKKCRTVTAYDKRLGELIDDMEETLVDASGLGLAAPQVGVLRRLCVVIDLPPESDGSAPAEGEEAPPPKFIELINPVITEQSGSVTLYEGCLSFPGRNGSIERPEKVTVKAYDRTGKVFDLTRTGMTARAICHECDHLDGITIVDRAKSFYEDEDHDGDEDGDN